MGRRSRKRATARDAGGAGRRASGGGAGSGDPGSGTATTRAERDAARRARAASGRPKPRPGRPTIDERPPPPWGSFPLSELLILVGIALMAWGLFSWDSEGNLRFAAGLAIASLGGLELSLREHLAGYRSHTTLLAGVAAFVVVTVLVLGPGLERIWILVLAGAAVFGVTFYLLRGLFKRRSGGLGFR